MFSTSFVFIKKQKYNSLKSLVKMVSRETFHTNFPIEKNM